MTKFIIESENKLIISRPILSRTSLKAILERLPSSGFLWVHRLLVIPATEEISLCNKKIQPDKIQIHIRISYEEQMMKLFGKQTNDKIVEPIITNRLSVNHSIP